MSDWKIEALQKIIEAGNNHDIIFKVLQDAYDSGYNDALYDYDIPEDPESEPIPWEDLD